MSTSSFAMNDMFAMLNRDGPSNNLRNVGSDRHVQRPVSEMLKRESFKSPESNLYLNIYNVMPIDIYS